jgi:hypothetical protein
VLHEVFVQLLHRRPSLAAELLHDSFGIELDFDLAVEGESILAEVASAQYRADQVVLLERGGKIASAIIVEVQLRPDRDKVWTWPAYVALLRARLRCPVHLLVVAPRRSTATWAAKPIALGPRGFVLRPWVVGPAVLPHVTDPGEAMRRPELSILSAITHARAAMLCPSRTRRRSPWVSSTTTARSSILMWSSLPSRRQRARSWRR